MEELLTVQQVANRLQLKPSWVYAHTDDLGAIHVGKYLRFRWERVLECLEESQKRRSQSNLPALPIPTGQIQILRNR